MWARVGPRRAVERGSTVRKLVRGLGQLLDRWAMRRYQRAAQRDATTVRDGEERLNMAREGRIGGPHPGE